MGVDRSNGGSGRQGGRGGLSISNQLGVMVSFGVSLCLGRLTFIHTVTLFATSETESFSDATSTLSWRELL